jgi:hypothetical protein
MKLRLILSFVFVAASTINGSTQAALRTVALTGQQAPGAPAGSNFIQLTSVPSLAVGPSLNNSGRVAFAGGSKIGNGPVSWGIWSDTTGALAAIARKDTPAPGTAAGVNFATFNNPVLNDAGRVAFDATLNTAGSVNAGIWSEGNSGLNLVARRGSAAPGAGANFLNLFPPSLGEAGHTTFRAQLAGPGVTTANDDGVWAEKAGVLTLMARAGSQAPGVPAGLNFDHFPQPPIMINATGQIAFRGFLNGAGVTADNDVGIWSERAGGLTLVAREGGDVPGDASADFTFIGDPVANRLGQTAFVALLFSPAINNAAVMSEGGGTLAIAARKGSQAPGAPAGVSFANFSSPLLNGEGHAAFTAGLSGGVTTSTDSGIWSQRGGALNLVAREGAQAPGAPAGVNFSAFANSALNSASQMAFTATLTGAGVTAANDGGIWVQGLAGDLRLVAREGDQLEVAPGVSRTIAELHFAGGVSTEDGRRIGLNDRGEVAFLATFTDSSSGIFVSDVAKAAAADFDGDADVDGADFLVWQQGVGRTGTGQPNNGDANGDGNVNAADLTVWKTKYNAPPTTIASAAVPEPATLMLGIFASSVLACISRASRSRPS